MNVPETLARLPRAYAIGDSCDLVKEAEKLGCTRPQWQSIAREDQKISGNWNYLAFKAMVLGTAAMIVPPLMAIIVAVTNGFTEAAIRFLIVAGGSIILGLLMRRWGKQEALRSGLATAVLRARAASMSNNEISILKDNEHLKTDRDSQAFLDSLKTSQSH
jgi:hypothetical protein